MPTPVCPTASPPKPSGQIVFDIQYALFWVLCIIILYLYFVMSNADLHKFYHVGIIRNIFFYLYFGLPVKTHKGFTVLYAPGYSCSCFYFLDWTDQFYYTHTNSSNLIFNLYRFYDGSQNDLNVEIMLMILLIL